MDDDKQLKDVADALGLSSVLPAVYQDLLSPAIRELGDGLTTIAKAVKIALAPIEATVWGYEKVREWLSLRVTKILADRKATEVISPPLSISGPLTIQMIFASEEPDLRELYANLLASVMDSRTARDVHPSFVTIIQQLTPDEAKIISLIESLYQNRHELEADLDADIWTKMRKLCSEAKLNQPNRIDVYIENLIRLRLLRHVNWSDTSCPEWLDNEESWIPLVSASPNEFIILTAFGRAFIASCVAK